jgi:hypothetical protein
MEHVRVELERTGGFTGRPVRVTLDSRQLPPADAAQLVALVAAVDLDGLGGADRPAVGADLMRYALTIVRGDDRWTGTVSDPHIPASLRPLLQFLTAHA